MPRLLEEEEPIDPEASLGTVLATSVVLGVVHVLTGPDHLSGPSSLTHPSALMLLSGRAPLPLDSLVHGPFVFATGLFFPSLEGLTDSPLLLHLCF